MRSPFCILELGEVEGGEGAPWAGKGRPGAFPLLFPREKKGKGRPLGLGATREEGRDVEGRKGLFWGCLGLAQPIERSGERRKDSGPWPKAKISGNFGLDPLVTLE